jgi:protein-S-isoprenylcysteine O-methyltransferase Ste14
MRIHEGFGARFRATLEHDLLCGLIVYVSIRGFYRARAESNRAVLRQTGAVEYALQAILLPGVLVYRFVRHPMYGSIWLWCLAQGLMLANWLAGWYAVIAFALMYFVRTPREEKMMREFFGQPYLDYMGRTGRIFPRPRGRRT